MKAQTTIKVEFIIRTDQIRNYQEKILVNN